MKVFREGQIVVHKISKEKFVIIKYRCLLYRLFCYQTTKEIIYVSLGKHDSDNFNISENELRKLTDEEIKQDKKEGKE